MNKGMQTTVTIEGLTLISNFAKGQGESQFMHGFDSIDQAFEIAEAVGGEVTEGRLAAGASWYELYGEPAAECFEKGGEYHESLSYYKDSTKYVIGVLMGEEE